AGGLRRGAGGDGAAGGGAQRGRHLSAAVHRARGGADRGPAVNDVGAAGEVAAAPVRRWPWYAGVGVLTAGGLGLRIATVYGRPNRAPGGYAYTYHYSANLLASGHG